MNPGPVEEVGQTARSIVDALKAQPAVLVLALMVIILLVYIFYAQHAAATFRHEMLQLLVACSKP